MIVWPVAPLPVLWLRWSWRDLRQHWIAVLSIAAVVAIGTGVYAGLGSRRHGDGCPTTRASPRWNMHDLGSR